MRATTYLVCFLIAIGTACSQGKKYLVSPGQEVIPLGKHSADEIVSGFTRSRSASNHCPAYTAGFDPADYPPYWLLVSHNHMVFGQWYVVPADGTIDTVYFYVTSVPATPPPAYPPAAVDSTLFLQIHTSYITPDQGPGARPGPYRPPCTSWGYYQSTNDPTGMTAFAENATPPNDSAWIPTNRPPSGTDLVPSFSPFGRSIWGLEGYPIRHIQPNTVIRVPLDEMGVLQVHAGDVIFISFMNPGPIPYLVSDPYDAIYDLPASVDAPWPPRTWKYYPTGSTMPSNCAGVPMASEVPGWFVLGALSEGSDVYNIWYSMTPTSAVPPVIAHVDQLHNTLSTDPQTVTCTIYDCNSSNPAVAGIRNAWIRFRMTPASDWSTALMTHAAGDQFEVALPGMSQGSTMEYRIVAEDSVGLVDSSAVYSYRVVALNSLGWYRIDTSSACTPAKIASSGTPVDTSQWFIAPRDFGGMNKPQRGDDGTAGPFPVSNGFVYFGDTMQYAWIGVNGAIALSKTAVDTIDINAGGFWTDQWDFPYKQHHSRTDTPDEENIPKAFIAPFWSDWVNKIDSPLTRFGSVRCLDDSTRFVVEWDSLGYSPRQSGGHSPDIEAFRVVLDKTDYSISFQYDDVGIPDSVTLDLVGVQSDSNYHPVTPGQYPPYAFFNKDGYPAQTQLHNGLCIRYLPALMTCCIGDGWNLLSVPGFYQNNQTSFLYPTATSTAFTFQGGYTPASTLENGTGYWIKFSGPQCFDVVGKPVADPARCIHLSPGWNIIGPFASPVPLAGIRADPCTGIGFSSSFIWYSPTGGYAIATALLPCYGYWVHSGCDGCLYLSGNINPESTAPDSGLSVCTKITFTEKTAGAQTLYIGPGSFDPAKYQMPPSPPGNSLNARFASNRMVETYPAVLDKLKKYEYPVSLGLNSTPLTIRWQHPDRKSDNVTLRLKTAAGKLLAVMNGDGKITLNAANLKSLIIDVSPGRQIPGIFALGTNYPNPFNPTTRFTVDIPRSGQVDVSLYDILGRKIATILNSEQTAGSFTLEWDGRTDEGIMAPTGVYFVRMTVPSENFTAVKKIMLVK